MESESLPESAAARSAEAAEPVKEKESWWATLRFLLLSVPRRACCCGAFVIAPFSIPSGSMLPRLMIGDYLFVVEMVLRLFALLAARSACSTSRAACWAALPERGDVVVFRYPAARTRIG